MLRLTERKNIKIKNLYGIQTVSRVYPSGHVFRKVSSKCFLVSWEACITSTIIKRRPDYRFYNAIRHLIVQPDCDKGYYYRGFRLRGNILC